MPYNHAYQPTLTEEEVNQIDEDDDYEWLGEPDYYQYEPDDDAWSFLEKDTDLFDNINY